MIKKISQILLVFLVLFFFVMPVFAQDKPVNIYFFWGQGCPHCAAEKPFLQKLEKKYPTVKVYDFEVWNSKENRELLIEVGKKLNVDVSGVPFTVIGDQHFIGWLNEETTGASLEKVVQSFLNRDYQDVVGEILNSKKSASTKKDSRKDERVQKSAVPTKLNLPVFGEIETKNISLPVLAVMIGFLDGFNPCAMWTLLFLISLLLGMKDKKRRWILGTTFIVASALVYFLFMAAWLNLLLFVGFIFWVRVLIALVALGGGGYNLREFFVNKDSGCKVTGDEKRRAVFEKLKDITHKKQFLLALVGIILLAFAVNLVELICSAGFPVVFTQILTLSNLAKWQYYAYMVLYIFFFMIDDLFVFFVSMITLEMTGVSTKYSRISHLIGGILMIIIGLLLIFKPEWLMFG